MDKKNWKSKDAINFIKEVKEWQEFFSLEDVQLSDTVLGHIALKVRSLRQQDKNELLEKIDENTFWEVREDGGTDEAVYLDTLKSIIEKHYE